MNKNKINEFNPCKEGLDYYNTFETIEDFWMNCDRGNWMLWLASKLNIDIRILTLTKAYCAKTVYHLLKNDGSKEAIVAAINFGRGLISKYELRIAANTAYCTYSTDIAIYYANNAAYTAAHSNFSAAYTASVANAAIIANATDAYTAGTKNKLKTANICRKYLTTKVLNHSFFK